MRTVLAATLCIMLILAGFIVVALIPIWWVVWLVAFPMMYIGGLGILAAFDDRKPEE